MRKLTTSRSLFVCNLTLMAYLNEHRHHLPPPPRLLYFTLSVPSQPLYRPHNNYHIRNHDDHTATTIDNMMNNKKRTQPGRSFPRDAPHLRCGGEDVRRQGRASRLAHPGRPAQPPQRLRGRRARGLGLRDQVKMPPFLCLPCGCVGSCG